MSCVGCGKDGASMQCPTCKSMGLPLSLFCGQDCFKKSWATHKLRHDPNLCVVKTMLDAERNSFHFTGELRPGLITPKRKVPEHIARPDYADHPEGASKGEELSYRSNKCVQWTPPQIAKIREVCRRAREVLDTAVQCVKPGMTTDEIDRVVHEATVQRDMYPSTLNYMCFPKSCCTSINEVICHGIPDSTVLKDGDIVNVDVSCYYGGFHADLNETVFVGTPDPESIRLVHATYECMMAGISICKPNELYKDIGNAIQPVADRCGYGVVRGITGHGIGELFHCAPNVPHYANSKAPGVMRENHVFTVEPMINMGKPDDIIWPDNWTIVTRDGSRSAQFEHTVVVTKDGVEILTPYVGGKPFYQKQLEALGIPLPSIEATGAADAAP